MKTVQFWTSYVITAEPVKLAEASETKRKESLRQFVFTFAPRPLWLTWATMCTYRVQTFNFFKTGTISIIISAFENWKFDQADRKMDDLARLSLKQETLFTYISHMIIKTQT